MPTPENQKKIEYLSRYQKLGKRIKQLNEERAVWLSKACKVSQTLSDMPKAKNASQGISGEIERYIEISNEITQELKELHRLRREIRAAICGVKDDTLQTLLLYRYISGMTWEQIGEKLFYTHVWLWTLHRRALDKISIPRDEQ